MGVVAAAAVAAGDDECESVAEIDAKMLELAHLCFDGVCQNRSLAGCLPTSRYYSDQLKMGWIVTGVAVAVVAAVVLLNLFQLLQKTLECVEKKVTSGWGLFEK